MAADKTEGPAHCLIFLGIEIDTVAMEARLGATRLAELRALLEVWESKTHASIKDRERLAGILNFASCVVHPGRTYMARILQDLRGLKRSAAITSSEIATAVGEGTRSDIRWWRSLIGEWNGIHLLFEHDWTLAPKLELFTDACNTGYGAYFRGSWFCGEWTEDELVVAKRAQRISMPYLELRAVVLAAAAFAPAFRGLRITFRCDCKPAVEALVKGTSGDPGLASLLRFLHTTSVKAQFDCRAEWIAGESNDVADVLSRMCVSDTQAKRSADLAKFRELCPAASVQPLRPPQLPPLVEM